MNDKIKKTILLVEDEIITAMSQKALLEKYGYKVVTINTGEKAIEIFTKENEIELALLPESRKAPLEKCGYNVITASSAKQAVEIFKENDDIKIVLMDIDLGKGMDGTEAAVMILKLREIPILFLSSHTEPEVVAKTEKITSYGYVVKNSSITVLDASIKMAFKLFDANKKVKEELLERKRLDDICHSTEVRYRRIFESTKEGILILDAETGMIVDVNPFLINLLGYSYEMFMGKTIWDIGFMKDILGNKDKFQELLEKNYARYENLPLETASGKIIEVEFISNVYDVVNVKVIQCNIRDITERKEVETGLENTRKELEIIKKTADEASEFAESIINTVREPLLSLDQNLRVVTASRSFYEFFKVKPIETVGQLIYDLGNKQWDIPKLRELLETILPEKTAFDNYEVEHDFTTIGRRIMLLNARQVQQSSGKQRTILLAIEDITQRKEIEAGLEKTRKELVVIKNTADEASEFAESIINTVREPLLSLDQDLRVVTASRSFYEFFKVKPIETVGQLIYDLGNKQWDIPKLRELLENILPEQEAFDNYEVEHDFTTIGRRIMLLNARQIERRRGKERIILLAIEDITKRKEFEAGLEKTRKELAVIKKTADEVSEFAESMIDTVREPLIALNQDLRVVTASRSFYEFFKVKPIETVGQLIYDLGNKQWDIPKLRDLLETILPEKTTFDNYEVEHDFTAIGRRIMLLNARQIQRGLEKERIILLAIEDITERKEIETGLEKTCKELAVIKKAADEASEFAESIINTVREPLLSLNQDLRVITASRSFYEFFKVKPIETIGHLIYDLGNKQWDIPKLRELLETILPAKTAFDNYEVEHDFKTIGRRIMLLNARQIEQESGRQRTILLAIEDITERRATEKKNEALLMEKNIILKEVHHRTKNSMNTIIGLLNLQTLTLTDPIAVEALKDTESRVQSMMVLYDKLYRSIDYNEISIKEYLNSLIDDIIINFPNNNMVKIEKNMDDFIISAKTLQSIGIIVNELLTNIMKYAFTGRDNGLITATVLYNKPNASIIIQDNGVGIPDSINFDNSTGFGLMLVRMLTEQIGGSIRLVRESGTKIILEFET